MSTKPRSQLHQGLALPAEAIMPTTPRKVATPSLFAILCTYILHYTIHKKLITTANVFDRRLNQMMQLSSGQKEINEIVSDVLSENNGVNNEYFSEIASHSSIEIKDKLFNVEKIIENVQNTNEIEEILFNTEPEEDGGLVAMSGFYYQLLVTIHYMVEMFQGKWTNIVVDHHQDIIAYNDTTIRFVQVKTKNVIHCPVSETLAYSEWIPKLISNQKMFEGYDYKLEFELVSNCIFRQAPRVCKDFEQFYDNTNFENGFVEGDLFTRTIENTTNYNLNETQVTSGIKAFKVTHINHNSIKKILCHDIGEYFNSYYRADDVVIDMIISYLFKKCYFPENSSIQIVNEKDSEELIALIRNRMQAVGEKDITTNSTKEVLGDFIEGIKDQYKSTDIYDEFSIVIDEFESELLSYFADSDIETIFTFLNKYLFKSLNSTYFRSSKAERQKKESERVFKVMLLVKLYFGGRIIVDSESKKFLLINIASQPFNIFGVKEEFAYTIKEAMNEFEEVFQSLEYEDQFSIANNPSFKIILAGEFDNESDPVDVIEVVCKEVANASKLLLLEDDSDESIARVKSEIKIVDVEDSKIDGIHKMRRRYGNISEMKRKIKEDLDFEKL
ncbi:hypothetical protein CSV72_05520 [Sporosarcina sp. P20a]|uniref:dsDNA nuclease domain-containing protein n=1 Tax=Sporosarcina sp. P20a TaxID=2048256 RepID=UPI000C164533|nr:dsDNA nuclease domain-containing protein [Sporosarcina sp. P20a]PIC87427.1 hypothetical protein CSV72_05520 [Sporosarcina sp. P20a]